MLILHCCQVRANSDESKQGQITCSGRVVNEQGQAVEGAKVSLYQLILSMELLSFDAKLDQRTTTQNDGTFTFKTQAEDNDTSNQSIILVDKVGSTLGWANWYLERDHDVQIVLGQSEVLAGQIVDQSGRPVRDAKVRISAMLITSEDEPRYVAGKISEQLFSCQTDAEGQFKFERIPANATAEFIAQKPGLATVSTLRDTGQLQFHAGRDDIEITLPVEAKIKGSVVTKETGRPVPGVKLIAFQGERLPFSGHEPVTSGEDGAFAIDALCEGKQLLYAVLKEEGFPEWVAQPVEVDVEAGKTVTGLKVELSKGGLVELLVTELNDDEPIRGANVGIQNTSSNEQFDGVTDENGMVRKRLAPGEYKVTHVYKRNFPNERRKETFTVEDGKTNRVIVRLKDYPKVTGTVRDENGLPVVGARIKICPMGRGETTSDREGRFEVRREDQDWASSVVPYVVARHFERNLAGAVEIEEGQRVVDVNMTPGIVCEGKVVDADGKPIENAKVYLTFWSSGHGTSMAHQENMTDADGHYEIKAVPRHYRYSVNAGADGFGQDYVRISTEDANACLKVETISLASANLSVSGIVVDMDDKPVENAQVSGQGRGQPFRHTRTNAKGQFTLEDICDGKIRITAGTSSPTRMYGSIKVEGGATDVRIAIGQRAPSTRYQPKPPPSLLGEPLPDVQALGIAGDIESKRLLICFFDMRQRPSRHCLTQLAKQAESLKAQGVAIAAVQATPMDQNELSQWVKKSKIPFPVGMIRSDEKKTRFAWGVRSLPWLILTDKNHVVVSQGFNLGDLEKQLK